MKYSDILNNPHFNNLGAIIRVPFQSPEWRRGHSGVPFWNLNKAFVDATPIDGPWNTADVISSFTTLITSISTADPHLTYTEDDINWFVAMLDSEEHKAVVKMFQAWYSAPDTMLTPAEVAAATGTAESTWRNKAAAGHIPGAEKKGKQWLLPRSILRSQGIDV